MFNLLRIVPNSLKDAAPEPPATMVMIREYDSTKPQTAETVSENLN